MKRGVCSPRLEHAIYCTESHLRDSTLEDIRRADRMGSEILFLSRDEIVNVDDSLHWKHKHGVCVKDHMVSLRSTLLKVHKAAKCIQNLFFLVVGQRFAEEPKKDHKITFVVKRFALDLFACDIDLKR